MPRICTLALAAVVAASGAAPAGAHMSAECVQALLLHALKTAEHQSLVTGIEAFVSLSPQGALSQEAIERVRAETAKDAREEASREAKKVLQHCLVEQRPR